MVHSGLIFDGDDTLWETMPLYLRAKERFYDKMQKLGFDQREVITQFEMTDCENVQVLGFSKERFPKSIQDTYEFFCKFYKKPFNEIEKFQIATIGQSVFTEKPNPIEGVHVVLETLRKGGFLLILATKGDPDIQKERIKDVGLSRYFDRIYIFPEKTTKELYQIVDECRLDQTGSWSIGNSIKSDINPALVIGMKAIWIPYYTWDYEEEAPMNKDGFYKVQSIKDIPKIVRVVTTK